MLAIAIVFSRGFAQVARPTKELVVTEVVLPSQVERGLSGDMHSSQYIRHRQPKCTRPSRFETAVQVRTLRSNTAYRPVSITIKQYNAVVMRQTFLPQLAHPEEPDARVMSRSIQSTSTLTIMTDLRLQ
ncbi:hypothetical protein PS870_06545 [Pseudomonas fluorescens]|uniref:Uncharacterized protein n=1 Tax=Pseudomonas fluorescens TaxID=294 RepID=A0A5E7QLM4_PSEFL|nr:hypothetical protein PS870_06545 [Pseudomonas fluorescens]